ncbi:Leucine-rich repeat receptor-like kinase protein THICK TASSEL DWARF1 [Bienertia sinuspersici]
MLKDLHVGNNQFGGLIPVQVGNHLVGLQILELYNNSFEGSVLGPHLWETSKCFIYSIFSLCTNLSHLALASNSLTGQLLLSLTNLRMISEIDVSKNSLSRNLSSYFFTNWTELIMLQLHYNQVTDSYFPANIQEHFHRLSAKTPHLVMTYSNLRICTVIVESATQGLSNYSTTSSTCPRTCN